MTRLSLAGRHPGISEPQRFIIIIIIITIVIIVPIITIIIITIIIIVTIIIYWYSIHQRHVQMFYSSEN